MKQLKSLGLIKAWLSSQATADIFRLDDRFEPRRFELRRPQNTLKKRIEFSRLIPNWHIFWHAISACILSDICADMRWHVRHSMWHCGIPTHIVSDMVLGSSPREPEVAWWIPSRNRASFFGTRKWRNPALNIRVLNPVGLSLGEGITLVLRMVDDQEKKSSIRVTKIM